MEDDSVQAIYVMNYANRAAAAYGKFENFGTMPPGAVLVKYSMMLSAKGGTVEIAPAYSMRKVARGKSPQTQDWTYGVDIPTSLSGRLKKGDFSFQQEDCAACHMAVGEQTYSMLFIPPEFRIR